MFADKNVIKHLEIEKIVSQLAAKARTELGIEYAANLLPAKDLQELQKRRLFFEETEKYRDTVCEFPWNAKLVPIARLLDEASEGGLLTGAELVKIRAVLKCAMENRTLFSENCKEYPSFELPLHKLRDMSAETEALSVLDEDGRIYDSATEKLKTVREEMRLLRDTIRRKSRAMLNDASIASMLQDRVLILRNGRHAFLVRQDAINKFPGIVVDRSGSGNSIYMEPHSLIKLNNEYSVKRGVEENEELKILRALTALMLEKKRAITAATEILGQLDFFYAISEKIRLENWHLPKLSAQTLFSLKEAKHPLLGKQAVAIDIECGKNFKTVVITGPNTGGKTVALKTAGVCVLLAWLGCPIPACEKSEVGDIEQLCADIGDEQSIEQSLSTFSAHIKNITEIISVAGEKTFVLLDELGAGTDPDEGAALGIALLDWLRQKSALVLATTHHNPIKHFATSTQGIETASVEFNIETLSPTYRIVVGIPGQSNALLIAQKLGMPREIINRAQTAMSSREISMESIVAELHKKRAALEKENSKLEAEIKRTSKLKEEYEQKIKKLEEKKDDLIAQADKKAKNIIRNAEESARALIKNLEIAEAESVARRELEKKRSHFSKINSSADKREEKKAARESIASLSAVSKATLEAGDTVQLIGTNRNATVLEIRGKKALLQAGVAEIEVPISKLAFVGKYDKTPKPSDIKINVARPVNVPMSITVRHLRVDEALPIVEQYLDRAYRAGYETVTVIHGRGEGILRRAVQELCERIPYVKEHNLGGPHEGGYGVTVVKFTK